MHKATVLHKIATVMLAFISLLVFLTAISGVGVIAYAAETVSNVLDDLYKDKNFNFAEYPENPQDYSLEVIQIAESTQGNLVLYTYQPCQGSYPLLATEINMSLSKTVDGTKLYRLTLLNINGVFAKYKVEGVKVNPTAERFYSITSIYRDYIKDIDGGTDNGNLVNEKAFSVGQYWKVTTQGDTVNYEMIKVDTVMILNPFTSYIRQNKNHSVNGYFQDNYYVAFNTERNIEKLLSATVEYRIQDYFYKENNVLGFDNTDFWNKSTFSNERRLQKEVYCDEVNELNQQGFNLFGIFDFNKTFTWKRIQSSADFTENAGASSSDNDEVKKLQWVLMFDETSVYRYQSNGTLITTYEETGQIIDEVAVLRLEFVEDGVTYNLGAVSDKVSNDYDFNDGTGDPGDSNKKRRIGIIGLIILIVLIIIFFPLISPILGAIVNGVVLIICLPFKAISALFKRKKE